MKYDVEMLKVSLFKHSTNSTLDVIEEAYNSSVSNQSKYKKDLEDKWEKFQKEVDSGSITEQELAEMAAEGYDYGEHLGEMAHEIENAISILREAFITSIHHLWERQVNRLMKKTHYDEVDAFHYLKGKGFNLDEKNLKILRLTANVAKHDRGRSANDLYKFNPRSFDATKIAEGATPGYDNIIITDDDVEQFFRTVRISVPRD